ncbi:MAG TPA: malate dehydrogenase, partial [Paludibacteraceae bacterium]|nr:malate dehydrogenase [Paludibacteraceae bacterium]
GAAAAFLVEAIIHDERKIIPCSVYLEGEYGQNDICLGIPALIGKNGIEKILQYSLNYEERELFRKSAASVHETNDTLKKLVEI